MHKQNHVTQSALKQNISVLKQYRVWGTFIAISGIGHLCLLFFLFFLSGNPTAHLSLLVNKRLSGKQVDVLLANAYSRRGANRKRVNNGGVKVGAKNSGLARNSGLKKNAQAGTSFGAKKNNGNASRAQQEPNVESVKKGAHKTTLGDNKNKVNKKIDNSQKIRAKKEKEKQLAKQKLAQEKRQKELEQKKSESQKAKEKKVANKKSEKNSEKNKVEKKKELAKKTEQKKETAPEPKLEKMPEPVADPVPATEPAPISEQAISAQEHASPGLAQHIAAALGLLETDQARGTDQVAQDSGMPVMIEEEDHDVESLLRYVALQKECSRCWKPPVGVDKACACTIKMCVDQQGKVSAIEMVEKSGILMFDSAAKMTVYAMELPKWAYNKSLVITFRQE